MTQELRSMGYDISENRVARLMQENGLSTKKHRSFRKRTDSTHGYRVAENTLGRDFSVGEKNRCWVGDITYLRVGTQWRYLATILDVGTRRWMGYAVADHMRTSLVTEALSMAITHEGKRPKLLHSDRGSQYARGDHRRYLQENNIDLSMSRKGNCWDNAVAESFFATFKNEVADTFASDLDVRHSLFSFFLFYNKKRRHSALGYVSPENYLHSMEQLQQKNIM